ncbi:MAG: NAD(P)H-hydrate dehydratase [Elusimicrobia bacterium]|nr:NAD(P)H-hydrate dehydratase [Elusimicrobiota bacterium]
MRIAPALVQAVLPKRKSQTQKWDYGHCLIIAGSKKLLGAAVIAAKAALRGGAGLVTLATPKSLQGLIYAQILEALTLPLEETEDGTVDFPALLTVMRYIQERGVTAIVIGPGLTRDPHTARFIHGLCREAKIPMILDADAINVQPPLIDGVFRCLTPHRREFARLVGISEQESIEQGPALAARFVQSHPGVALVLKGHQTKIFFGGKSWINPTGNPGMAKGGAGDVLAGFIGALTAQKSAQKRSVNELVEAIAAGVYLHGLSGDLACRSLTEYAMNAEDIIAFLPEAMKKTLR